MSEANEHTFRVPWTKGRLVGQKRPLRSTDVWIIRTRLGLEGKDRDLALFNLAIDSKLRACDLVGIRVSDIQTADKVRERASIVQKKTGRSVQFELTEATRLSVRAWLDANGMQPSGYLFPGRLKGTNHLSTRQYSRLVHVWIERTGLNGDIIRHAFRASHQGFSSLPENRKPACGSIAAGPHQARNYGTLSRY